MDDVKEIKHQIRLNEMGRASVVLARTMNDAIVRIIDARRRHGRLEGRSLASGKWFQIRSAV